MSTLEKNLYKRVKVSTNRGSQAVTRGSAYRGFSSINENVEGYALYDFDLIKQDDLTQMCGGHFMQRWQFMKRNRGHRMMFRVIGHVPR